MPNGRSIVLERQPGADAAGYSGLEDEVDNHCKELLGAAALSTLLDRRPEVNSGTDVNNTNSVIIQACGVGQGFSQSDWSAGGSTQSQYTANVDDPAGISGKGDRES
jgi:type IV secretory pathway VirB10-like protein